MSGPLKRIPRGSVGASVTFDATHDPAEPVGLRWDPTAVVGAAINVRRPDGGTAVWSASVIETRANGITALHALADGEVDIVGRYDAEIVLSFAGRDLKSFIDSFQVTESLT